jgi:hypothetical protein
MQEANFGDPDIDLSLQIEHYMCEPAAAWQSVAVDWWGSSGVVLRTVVTLLTL